MKVAAHRGYSGLYPENTMLAFKKAAEAGADEIELDVHLSKDGKVIVIHDETLNRVAEKQGNVRDLTFDELHSIDASVLYKGKYGFNPIPSLEEYFSWVKDTGITTNIELKNGVVYYEGLEEKTVDLIKKFSLEDRIIFSSFNHVSLLTCKKLIPSIPCGFLAGGELHNAGFYAKSNNIEYFHPEMRSLNDELIENFRQYGIELNVWTVNDMDSLLRLEAWGCRGVITNYPDVCKVWLSRKK
jgi:glycerophosphoryl diester phosphodiesterase